MSVLGPILLKFAAESYYELGWTAMFPMITGISCALARDKIFYFNRMKGN